jgi:hypothetical protein
MPVVRLIDPDQLAKRIGKAVLDRIFDDDNAGFADPDVVLQFCEDASSMVRGGLPKDYDLDAITADAASTNAIELRRITLDCAHAMAAIRHPGALKIDGFALMERVDIALKNIRLGQATLGTKTAPESSDQTISVAGDGENTRSYWP